MTPEQYVQDRAAKSGSSFYYAFLFLPPPRRAAITAFYAFCREVDDVVDEVQRPGRRARPSSPGGAARSRRPSPAQPTHPVMKALMPHAAAYGIEAAHLQAVIDGCQMDLEQTRYLDFAGLAALLPPGRRHRRRGVGANIFGRTQAATMEYAHRLGLAMQLDQHHPRRRRGRAPRPHLPADVASCSSST